MSLLEGSNMKPREILNIEDVMKTESKDMLFRQLE